MRSTPILTLFIFLGVFLNVGITSAAPNMLSRNLTMVGSLTPGAVLTFTAQTANTGTIINTSNTHWLTGQEPFTVFNRGAQSSHAIARSGSYLFSAHSINTLDIFNVSNTQSPSLAATYIMTNAIRVNDIQVQGSYLYVGSNTEIGIYNISSPTSPTYVQNIAVAAIEMKTVGNRLYAAAGGSLTIYDISNPSSPVQLSNVVSGSSISFDVQGNYAYLLGVDAFYVYDISNSASPVKIGELSLPNVKSPSTYTYLYDNVVASGSYVYIGTSGVGDDMKIINVSNPANPSVAGTYSGAVEGGTGLALNYPQLYMGGNYGDGGSILDVSNPSNIRQVGHMGRAGYTNPQPTEIIVQDFAVFTAEADNGRVSVLRPWLMGRFCLNNTNCITSSTNGLQEINIFYQMNTNDSSQQTINLSATAGTHTMYHCSDLITNTFDAVTESNETDNCTSLTYTVAAPPTSTLTINGSTGPLNVNKGSTLNINWGSTNAASCTKFGSGWGSGEVVGPTGNNSILATASDTYIINCGGSTKSVVVTVVNRAPTMTSVNYLSGTREINQPVTFTVLGQDQDNDAIYYEFDWDNNGVADGSSTVTVPSNTSLNANYTWTTIGTKTFGVRAVDSAGAVSTPWMTHQVTITAPPPTATMGIAINGGTFSTSDQTINPGDTITVQWNSSNATTCTGTNFVATGNAPSGSVGATPPAPGAATTYTATCTGQGGTATDSVVITSRQAADLTQPNITYQLSSGYNVTTGMYDSMTVTFNTTNTGGTDAVNANYELQFDRGRDGYEFTSGGSMGTVGVGQQYSTNQTISGGIPYGPAYIRVMVDSTNTVSESNETNNTFVYSIMIPPPNPGLDIVADRTQVREGESAVLSWSSAAGFAMTCRVYGPNRDIANPTLPTGTQQTAPIMAKSLFTISCTEPSTGVVFTDTTTVETTGKIEER